MTSTSTWDNSGKNTFTYSPHIVHVYLIAWWRWINYYNMCQQLFGWCPHVVVAELRDMSLWVARRCDQWNITTCLRYGLYEASETAVLSSLPTGRQADVTSISNLLFTLQSLLLWYQRHMRQLRKERINYSPHINSRLPCHTTPVVGWQCTLCGVFAFHKVAAPIMMWKCNISFILSHSIILDLPQ